MGVLYGFKASIIRLNKTYISITMKIGTKSVIFGAHCFFIHPFFLALAWWKLYSFPWDIRLWFVFFLHDIGYLGKPNMDGEEGETHPELGAKIVSRLFDDGKNFNANSLTNRDLWKYALGEKSYYIDDKGKEKRVPKDGNFWYRFSLYHSRFYSKAKGIYFSPLCAADKLAVGLEPIWLYLPRVILTGEIKEYMHLATKEGGKYQQDNVHKKEYKSKIEWANRMLKWCREWGYTYRNGKDPTTLNEAIKTITLEERDKLNKDIIKII